MALRTNVSAASGNLSTITAGSTVAGNKVFMGRNYAKVAVLKAMVAVTAATSTLTLTGQWQVSEDGSAWRPARPSNNPADVVIATGTSAATSVDLAAPDSCYASPYARFALITGVVTGGVADLYSIAYSYRQLTGADAT